MKFAFKIVLCFLCLFMCAYARIDNRTYTGDVDVLAVWINPKNIKVYINETYKPEILRRAVNIWDNSMRNDMNFIFVKNENEADITIEYVEKLNKQTLGITKTSHIAIQGKIYLHKAKIYIAKADPIGFKCSDAELLKTTLHELGHAIGIIGHSKSINDIMYYSSASTKNVSPSLRDIETVNKLYGF